MENSNNKRKKEIIGKITALTIIISVLIVFVVSIYYNITLQNQINERDSIISKLTVKDSILNEVFSVKYDSLSGTYSYTTKTREGKTLKYDDISTELDEVRQQYYELSNKYDHLRDSVESYKIILRLIIENYPIKYSITTSKKTTTYDVISETLDSAMILLPYFRDRLRYDSDKKSWFINIGKSSK